MGINNMLRNKPLSCAAPAPSQSTMVTVTDVLFVCLSVCLNSVMSSESNVRN
jgi:hypothetical protein